MNYKLRPAWARYGVTVGCVVLGWLARETLTPAFGPTALPFIFFFPAVALAAWYGGFGSGAFATILSAAFANWFFIDPIHSWSPSNLSDGVATAAFLLSCMLIVGAIEAMHRARAGALMELAARERAEAELARFQYQFVGPTAGDKRSGVATIPSASVVRWTVIAFAAYALIGGGVTLIGWFADLPRLTDWAGTGIAMFPNTGLAAICSGAALILATLHQRWCTRISCLLGLLVALVAGATLFQHISGLHLGIDTFLVSSTWGNEAAVAPGRMGPPASTSYTLIGLALILIASGYRGARQFAPILGIAVFAIVSLSLVGYMFGADPLFTIARFTGIAMQTATILLALALAVVASVPEAEPVRTLQQNSAAGMLARRSLPFIIGLLVLGWLRVRGQQMGLFDIAMGTSLLTLLLAAIFCGLLWWWAGAVAKYEAALRKSELSESVRCAELEAIADRLTLAMHGGELGAWETDVETGENFWDSRVALLLGLPSGQSDSESKRWMDFIHPSDRERVTAAFRAAAEGGAPVFSEDFRIRHTDGSIRWFASRGRLVVRAGTHRRVIGVVMDITEHKQAEEKLRQSETILGEELRAMSRLQELSAKLVQQGELKPLLQAILAAAADLTGTDKGNIQIYDANTGMLRILVHQGLGERLVKHFAEDGWVATCAQAAVKAERVIVEDVEKLDHLRGTVEFDIVLKDGIRSIQSTPLVSRDGRLLGMLNNHYPVPGRPDDQKLRYVDLLARQAADLIERHQSDAALRQSEQRFRTLLALLPVGVYTIEAPKGEISYYNDAAAVLWGRRPALGDAEERWCGSFRLWMPDGSSLPHNRTPMTQVLSEGRSFRNVQVIIERPPPDASRITVLVNIDPILDHAGHVVGAINVFHDVTALRETEEALREALKAKDHFLASVSHELRTPLTPALTMTEILQRNKTLPQSVKSMLDVIGRNVRLEAKLVNDLLDFSRTITGKLRVDLTECDVHEIVERAVRVCSGPSNAKQLSILVKLNARHRKFAGDATRLQQVFWNLIQNAIKFTSPGGCITISSRNEDGRVCVDVSDSGCGIEPDDLKRIFEPFTDEKPATHGSGSREGLGLGLSIAREIVIAHGGTLVAASDGTNRGATFTVSLPAPHSTTDLPPLLDERSGKTPQALSANAHIEPSSSCELPA